MDLDYYFGVPVVNSAPPYLYVENDRIFGGDPDDPLVYLGRGPHEEATPITPIPPEASQRTANMFKGAVEAHKIYNAIGNLSSRCASFKKLSESNDER